MDTDVPILVEDILAKIFMILVYMGNSEIVCSLNQSTYEEFGCYRRFQKSPMAVMSINQRASELMLSENIDLLINIVCLRHKLLVKYISILPSYVSYVRYVIYF